MNKYLLVLLTYLIGTNSVLAATAQVNSVTQFGGSNVTVTSPSSVLTLPAGVLTGYKTLMGGNAATNIAANGHMGVYDLSGNTNTQYSVPNGKSFVTSLICIIDTTGNNQAVLGTATAAFTDAVTSVTGGVYASGAAAKYNFTLLGSTSVPLCLPYPFTFAQNTFPLLQHNANHTTTFIIIGKEI